MMPAVGSVRLPCTTTAYSCRPPLSTRCITARYAALLGIDFQPRSRLSPGLSAEAPAGHAPYVCRKPASAAYIASVDSRLARDVRRSSVAVLRATTATTLMIVTAKITVGRMNPLRFEAFIGEAPLSL